MMNSANDIHPQIISETTIFKQGSTPDIVSDIEKIIQEMDSMMQKITDSGRGVLMNSADHKKSAKKSAQTYRKQLKKLKKIVKKAICLGKMEYFFHFITLFLSFNSIFFPQFSEVLPLQFLLTAIPQITDIAKLMQYSREDENELAVKATNSMIRRLPDVIRTAIAEAAACPFSSDAPEQIQREGTALDQESRKLLEIVKSYVSGSTTPDEMHAQAQKTKDSLQKLINATVKARSDAYRAKFTKKSETGSGNNHLQYLLNS